MTERRLPPITQAGMLSLACMIAGGIYLAAHVPDHVSLAPAIALVVAAALLLAGSLVALALTEGFPWPAFLGVARWALLAYALIAGLIEYAFLRNHMSGGPLVLFTCALVLFALQVPVLIGFTVARYAVPAEEATGAS